MDWRVLIETEIVTRTGTHAEVLIALESTCKSLLQSLTVFGNYNENLSLFSKCDS